jgi:S-methylmethionine-dependent homocysteine/selenocysteine methylase
MNFLEALEQAPVVLTDGAIQTRIAFETSLQLDPDLEVYRLIDDPAGRAALETVYRSYLDVGQRHALPMQLQAPTFRASPARVARAGFSGAGDLRRLNQSCVQMLQGLREEYGDYGKQVFIAGVLGPKGNAYDPSQALTADEAERYHTPQAQALTEAGADLLYGATQPAASEALGVARAMSRCGLPYVVGFVTTRTGTLLDGTPLHEVITQIDAAVQPAPTHFMFVCVHASVCRQGMVAEQSFEVVRRRMRGIKANGSARSPQELDALGRPDTESPEQFAADLIGLHRDLGFQILGGCCGTDLRHLARLATSLPRTTRNCRVPVER